MYLHYKESRQSMSPEKSIQFLKEGNQRFINNLKINRDHLEMINVTSEDQFPFASILTCSDSRTSSELIFDQGLGDLFSVRLAGNIASLDAIASLEFSCKILGSKLIVVLGHTNCGAIKGACDHVDIYNLKHLLSHITPALEMETSTQANRNSANIEFVNNITLFNIQHQIDTIISKSVAMREMIENHEIGIIGGVYDIATGKVNFFDNNIYSINPHMKAEQKEFVRR
ncbi:MAG: carbonic anhydrase [Saprospiraceae bacterium]|nr:carbonic anhydrase [Saprospiraceae bacterium]